MISSILLPIISRLDVPSQRMSTSHNTDLPLDEVVLPPAKPAHKNSRVLSSIGAVVEPLVSSPALQNAIQVLDQISEIGRVMPFISPAFVLLKIIVDVEKRAQDVDTKCSDLLERITFMLGHIPVLKNIEVDTTTRQVIHRMNQTLKDAAALITAYRKQGFVARRLSINNRDKFVDCATSINTCCKDLMISLQIHQTDKINILTRAIPTDSNDQEASAFVSTHGGVENVTHNRQLVEEYAKQQHLIVDDNVMEQLNAGLTETIEKNHKQLEKLLSSNVDAAIVYGLKGLAAEMDALEAQQKFTCVQCNKEFRHSTNGPKACSFHRATGKSKAGVYECCGATIPCDFGSHRERHHSNYAYEAFFQHANGVALHMGSTVEKWIYLEDKNIETDSIQKCFVGKLLRWTYNSASLEKPTIIIVVGSLRFSEPYIFETFTASELRSLGTKLSLTGDTLIFRTSPSSAEYAMAEWILSQSGDICGLRLSARAESSDSPWIQECEFDPSSCSLKGNVKTISEGGFISYKPASPYALPPTIRIGPELPDAPCRPLRKDFKSRSSIDFPIRLKCTSNPPLSANSLGLDYGLDYFDCEVAAFNTLPRSSQNVITVISASAFYRLIGDDYSPVHSCRIEQPQLPITIDPSQFSLFKICISVRRTKEESALMIRSPKNAFVARHRPLRIKLVVEDIDGMTCSLVMDYVYQPMHPLGGTNGDLTFIHFDNPTTMQRFAIIARQDVRTKAISFTYQGIGKGFDKDALTKIVYSALQTGITEVQLQNTGGGSHPDWEWAAYALVDVSCRRVYAFKVILCDKNANGTKRFGCLAYVACPDYGAKVSESTRPIQYATEIAKLPELEPYTLPSYPVDDSIDDDISEAHASSASTAPSTGAQIVLSEELNRRLSAMEASLSNLSRIATTLELIAEKMGYTENGHI